jgi:hypothetical protein
VNRRSPASILPRQCAIFSTDEFPDAAPMIHDLENAFFDNPTGAARHSALASPGI